VLESTTLSRPNSLLYNALPPPQLATAATDARPILPAITLFPIPLAIASEPSAWAEKEVKLLQELFPPASWLPAKMQEEEILPPNPAASGSLPNSSASARVINTHTRAIHPFNPAPVSVIFPQVEINRQDDNGNTALMRALLQGNVYQLCSSILSETDLDLQNNAGDTALMLAIHLGYLEFARKLIDYPLNILLVNKQQDNAFSLLFRQGYRQTYQHFLLAREMLIAVEERHSFILNVQIDGSNTLLCLAAELGEMLTVKKLITKGADPNIVNSNGDTPLMVAIKHNHLFETQVLLSSTHNLNQQNQEGDTTLMLAIRLGHLHAARELICYPLNLLVANKRQENVFSLLHQQGYRQSDQHFLLARAMIAALLNMPAHYLNVKIDGENTLLCLVADLGEVTAIRKLITAGADANISNGFGDTPLMVAIKQNRLFEATALLAPTANINQQNQAGDTALILAIRLGHIQIARALMHYPCNLLVINKNRESAFSLLAQQGYRQTYQHFLLTKKMLLAVEQRYPFLMEQKLDGINTLFCLAVEIGEIELIKRLLDKGVNLNGQNGEGNSPIMLAIKREQLELIYFLLSKYADLSLQNQQGKTAYTLAEESGWEVLFPSRTEQ
jgi:ankyrin repeat protein